MTFDFCPKCGHRLENTRCGDDECKVCPSCKKHYGSSPFPVVIVLVVNEYNEVLLLKQILMIQKNLVTLHVTLKLLVTVISM